MHLAKTNDMTEAQRQNLILGYLQCHKHQQFTAIELRNAIFANWGVDMDWHPCAAALDNLRNKDLARPIFSFDGMTQYIIL